MNSIKIKETKVDLHPLLIATLLFEESQQNPPKELLTKLKYQRLVYNVYAMFLIITGVRLCEKEPICSQYGPTFKDMDCEPFPSHINYKMDSFLSLDKNTIDLIESIVKTIYSIYKDYSIVQICEVNNRPGTPWYNATNGKRNIWINLPDSETLKLGKSWVDKMIKLAEQTNLQENISTQKEPLLANKSLYDNQCRYTLDAAILDEETKTACYNIFSHFKKMGYSPREISQIMQRTILDIELASLL